MNTFGNIVNFVDLGRFGAAGLTTVVTLGGNAASARLAFRA